MAFRAQFSVPKQLIIALIEQLIRLPPVFSSARDAARKRIEDRGRQIGIVMDNANALSAVPEEDRMHRLEAVCDRSLQLPAYYLKPFHAYEAGNMSWHAALEAELASKAVHATVMDPANKAVDRDGDLKMRNAYHAVARSLLDKMPGNMVTVRRAVDLGCSVGLSSLAVARAWPVADVIGIDASPYFVAVGQDVVSRNAREQGLRRKIDIRHGLAEATNLPARSVDLVNMCLVMHELPSAATRDIFAEAYRLLKPGGIVSLMEMDVRLPCWQDKMANMFTFAAFKCTEPWLLEYISVHVEQELEAAGFECVSSQQCTPTHTAFIGRKPW